MNHFDGGDEDCPTSPPPPPPPHHRGACFTPNFGLGVNRRIHKVDRSMINERWEINHLVYRWCASWPGLPGQKWWSTAAWTKPVNYAPLYNPLKIGCCSLPASRRNRDSPSSWPSAGFLSCRSCHSERSKLNSNSRRYSNQTASVSNVLRGLWALSTPTNPLA